MNKKDWRTGAVQIHVDLPPILLIKIKNDTKEENTKPPPLSILRTHVLPYRGMAPMLLKNNRDATQLGLKHLS